MDNRIKLYFKPQDLVCKEVYRLHGDKSWKFFDPRLIDNIVYIRLGLAKPITVNTWAIGGLYSQRGLRCNLCSLVAGKTKRGALYVSAHSQGMAVDFDVKDMRAEEVRKWIGQHAVSLPHPCRLELDTSWVHMDVRVDPTRTERVQYFKG